MIEIRGVSRVYGETFAVRDVSLEVGAGEVAAIVGTSGSGKTTLLRMINRLVDPTSGSILIAGADNRTVPAHVLRRGIGYVIQGHGLFPHRTVAANIATVPRLLGWEPARIAARIDELLALFSLDPGRFRDRMPHELSGGEAQRVGVARALAAGPPILLMDEPFGALDPVIRDQAQRDLAAIQRTLGTTVILVTHDMDEAMRLATRIGVMDAGRLLQYASPAEILAAPATGFVAELLGTGDRAFRLLSLRRVEELVEPGTAEGPPVASDLSLREALAECLWSGRHALPVEDAGRPMGRVTRASIELAGVPSEVSIGLALRAGLAAVLVAFLLAPERFAPAFAPLTRNGAPAIYTQTPMLRLAVSHLLLTAVAVAAASLVAIGAAVLATRPGGREFLPLSRAVANIGQTFPPVAVLALAVPVFGFGLRPTLIALFLYALLPIFEMSLTGLSSLSPPVAEAARGMGMTERQRLWQVEFPLAVPAMLTGVRIATVISLATATLGSTVAASTLGEVIVAGLLTGNTAFVLQGGLVVGGLAILLNEGFLALERLARGRIGSA